MLIRYYGHALFLLESAAGFRIATDPYDETVGYPLPNLQADVVTLSHAHFDHHNAALCPDARSIEAPGRYAPAPGVSLRTVDSFHDDCQGAKRGKNLIFCYEIDGLRLCHLGDLGHRLTPAQCQAIGPVDILMLPVGGHYTLEPPEACEVMKALAPQVTLPMHYRTQANPGWAIAPLGVFEGAAGKCQGPCPLLRLTREDVTCSPPLVEMSW